MSVEAGPFVAPEDAEALLKIASLLPQLGASTNPAVRDYATTIMAETRCLQLWLLADPEAERMNGRPGAAD